MPENKQTFLHRADAAVDALQAAEVAARAAQACRLWAAYEIACLFDAELPIDQDAVVAEVGCALHLSHRSAGRLLDEAVLVCERPALLSALHEGLLDVSRVKMIATLLEGDLQCWEPEAIDYGQTHTAYELRRWILRHLPETDEKARKAAMDKRCIEVSPDSHGMSHLYGYLPSQIAEEFFTALDALARQDSVDDGRTLDQRRADAVQSLLDARTQVHTQVSVVLPAASAIPGTINGSPIPHDTATRLAAASDQPWRVWLADNSGRIVHAVDSAGYRIPAVVARTVRARDQHCRFPGCQVPAARCDLDHTIAWPLGPTHPDNLHCLCRKHHRIKHETGWSVTCPGENELEWVSPTGRLYRTRPPNLLELAG